MANVEYSPETDKRRGVDRDMPRIAVFRNIPPDLRAEFEIRQAAHAARKRQERIAELAEAVARNPRPPSKLIIALTAARHGVTADDILGRSRRRHIVRARQAAMCEVYRLRRDMSIVGIGRRVFDRDHSCVFRALRKEGLKPPKKAKA